MIFFDLEFFVPERDRNLPGMKGTMIFNPARADHILLGGHFIVQGFRDTEPRVEKSFWIWDFEQNEKKLLAAIADLFQEEWHYQQGKKDVVLSKRVNDIVTCGIAIGRMDLPSLYMRAQRHKLFPAPQIFETFMKTKVIDLSQVACFLFPKEKTFYPKTANEITKRLEMKGKQKPSGKNVWTYYDDGDFQAIADRCRGEVESIVEVYHALQNRMQDL